VGIYETLRYFRSYSGNACHSMYCCTSRYLLFPADGGTPIQLYTGRRRMKLSYFRYWGRHQKSATLPRSHRIQLGETAVCYTVMWRSGSNRGPKVRSVRPTQGIPHLLWHPKVHCHVYTNAILLQLHPISASLLEEKFKE